MNVWTRLVAGQVDPFISQKLMDRIYCRDVSPCRSYICTRAVGHQGLHVASYGDGKVCRTAWDPAVPRELQLPEGF